MNEYNTVKKGQLTVTSTPPINLVVGTVTNVILYRVDDNALVKAYISGEDLELVITITNNSNKNTSAIIFAEIDSEIIPIEYQINDGTINLIDATQLENNTVKINKVDIQANGNTTIKIFGRVN